MGVRIILDGPCEMTGAIDMPGYPPTLVAVTGGAKNDVLDQPGDEPREGEALHLYAFAGNCFLDFRGGKDARRMSGEYGNYRVVPEGVYPCLDCEGHAVSPPSWPFERCTKWASGFHRIEVVASAEVPPVIEASAEAIEHIADIRNERVGGGLYGERDAWVEPRG